MQAVDPNNTTVLGFAVFQASHSQLWIDVVHVPVLVGAGQQHVHKRIPRLGGGVSWKKIIEYRRKNP